MDCHIEIFYENQWVEAAQIGFSSLVQHGFRASTCVFEYDFGYAFGENLPPVSLAFPVDAVRHRLSGWPAFLYDLVPQGNGRRFLLGRLQLADTQSADLPLLCAGAFNPIGRLRVREAVEYFMRHVESHGGVIDGFEFDELLRRDQEFHETMMVHGMLAAGGTGVQGVAPKYLLTEGRDGRWYPDAALPDSCASRHFIVKRPRGPTEADKRVLQNEARYMNVAHRLGIRTFDLPAFHDDMLFIPRFDRRVEGGRVARFHQESAAAIAGLAGFGLQANQFDLVAAIRRVVSFPIEDTIEFLKRDVLNMAMRNPDNHARNTAVQCVDGVTRLTPLFDFAPMYLDPEGIVRAARWYHPRTKKEMQSWREIIACLSLSTEENREVVDAMRNFGELLATLPDLMRESNIDSDIVEFVIPSINVQRIKLSELS